MRPRELLAASAALFALAVALQLGCGCNGAICTSFNNKPVNDGGGGELGRGARHLKESFGALANAAGEAIDSIGAADERAIGQAAAFNIIARSGGLVLEERLVAYVNALANHVGQQGKRNVTGNDGAPRLASRRFFVGVLDTDQMGAYGLPGGYLLVTRGLLENLGCESDLAWVLGHEIAHVDNEDGLKALKGTVGTTAFAKELVHFGAAKEGEDGRSASFRNPGFFARVVDVLTRISFEIGLGREDERVADAMGLEYATRAGYDAEGARRVLDLLATNPTRRKLFKSHDDPPARLALLAGPIAEKKGGELGIARYENACIVRLESARAAAARGN